jgi:hypothetical protein
MEMKYACLVYVDRRLVGGLSRDEDARLIDQSIEYDARLEQDGHLLMAQPLQEPHAAVTIRVRNGHMSSTDGPFAETKEHLGGFFLIEARDLNEAIEIAGTSPMAAIGSIEIRPFLEQTHSATGAERPKPRRQPR